jgi:hypothetical protein
MKALSPFLPDVPTLTSLFAGAGIAAPSSEPSERERSRPRFASTTPPPIGRAATPIAGAVAAPTHIRFPVSTVTAPAPVQAPLRTTIPPLDPSGAAAGSIAVASAPTRAPTGVLTAVVPPQLAAEALSDEAALQHIFGRRDRSAPPLQQRIDAFVDWLGVGVNALGSFVADVDGLILASRNVPDTYAVAVATLSHAEQSVLDYIPRPVEGSTTLELDDKRYLQVIRVESVIGKLLVGVIVAAPLTRTLTSMVRRLMRIGMEWEAVR